MAKSWQLLWPVLVYMTLSLLCSHDFVDQMEVG